MTDHEIKLEIQEGTPSLIRAEEARIQQIL